jgi:hypothetical protein
MPAVKIGSASGWHLSIICHARAQLALSLISLTLDTAGGFLFAKGMIVQRNFFCLGAFFKSDLR